MNGLPLRYAHRNVLLGCGGDAAALYRLGMSAYPFLPAEGKWVLARRLQRLAHTVAADFSVWRVNRAYSAERYVEHTGGGLDVRHQDSEAWRGFLSGHEQRLRDLGSHIPEVYLAVSLAAGTDARIGSGLLRGVDRVRRRVEEMAGIGGESPILASDLAVLVTREQRVYERLSAVIRARRARTPELQWLLRRATCRGIAEPEIEEHWAPDALVIEAPTSGVAFHPLRHDLVRCVNAAIVEQPRSLVVDGEHGRSYQAMLVVGALADAPRFPGASAEIMFAALERVPWPIDAVFHARWLGNRHALAAVRRRIADVEHAYSEQVQGAAFGPSLQAGEDRLLAREYEAQLQGGEQPPMLYAEIGLALGAPTADELERRVMGLREQYGDIQLHCPVGLQRELWLGHLPRPDGWL